MPGDELPPFLFNILEGSYGKGFKKFISFLLFRKTFWLCCVLAIEIIFWDAYVKSCLEAPVDILQFFFFKFLWNFLSLYPKFRI